MPTLGDKSLVHTYDANHRRVTRTTREWTVGGWDHVETTHFIYDGWNVIEEWSADLPSAPPTLRRTLTWGTDLSGSLQAAGGVGGLLMVEEINGTTTTAYHFHYDGNGNVTEITDHTGDPAASYRYDAFGNTLVATGTYATSNRYRFSTKPLDSEVTAAPLYYYGYRYYDPVTGRWPSRDPIEEKGGLNLYGFVGNDGVNSLDYLGQFTVNDYYSCSLSCDAALRGSIIDASILYNLALVRCGFAWVNPWNSGSCALAAFTAYKFAISKFENDHKKCLSDCNSKYPLCDDVYPKPRLP